ncbi:P-loop containing nucleoside triphosphate hydrolase protein [Leucogyrophana mollusca]|uniref:P-loop containing nucleoside triphosphate hydrolase protein n=1 Tax=Leucogyrophana mollusca TaxID=85980 RepID=A0ACB8BMJ9_9AGAM|nr:P-loop containing nucleoside triphosphate hydrolase protein [Leucogyrophana mollusca]
MARRTRATAEEDTDSLKENSQPTHVKAGKVKEEKVKEERPAKAQKVRDNAEDEGDDEQPSDAEPSEDAQAAVDTDEEAEEDGEGEGSPRGRKRVRVNAEGEAISSSQGTGRHRERVETLPRDDDGYIPGSIVRIQLSNFVTYDWVEFRPGPYLNMILGPNGTGKSSIACAICLGLNWSPSVLGRATELNSFVKNNKDSGYIEIELKGPKGEPNLVIRRNLNAKSNGSTFLLNGHSATGREITNRMAKLNVQVGNLCSFLPQDKVSEFAQMTPQQLLRETQRAAGDTNLTSWHDTLISSGKELKKLQELLNAERDQLRTMEERNAQLERDVQRYQERRRIEKEIETLRVLIPVNEYHEAKEVYSRTKQRQRQLHAKVRKLKDKNAPAHALAEQLAQKYKEYDKLREKKKGASRQKFQQMKTKWAESDKLDVDADELTNKLDGLKKAEKERARKIKELQAQIDKWQRELDNPPELENVQAINDEMRQLNTEHNVTRSRMDDLQERQKANIDASGKQKQQITNALDELKKLDDERHRKLQNLGQWDRDCADAVVWLRNNQDKFKMEVFEPPMICCTVPDKRFTNAVEACFNANQLKMLVTQCEEDYRTLNHYLNDTDKAGLRKGARINTWYRPKIDSTIGGPPMSAEEMQTLAFDGYAIDYVDCPDGLLWYLKKELNLHRTAIGLNGSKVDVGRAMEAVSRAGGASFVAGNTLNIVTRSRYGQRMAQNMTRDVRPARNLVNTAIDPEVKKRLDASILEARQALELIGKDAEDLAAIEREIRSEEAKYKKNYEALEARKKAVNDQKRRLAQHAAKIETNQNKLNDLENAPSVDDERARLKKKLVELSKRRIRIAKDYSSLIRGAITDQIEATRSGLEFLQVGANKNALETLCREKDEEYQKALAEFEEADAIFGQAKADAKQKRDISVQLVRSMDEEFQAAFAKMEADGSVHDRTVDELRAELEVQQAKLELIMQTNPGVVEQYERRKAEIETLTKTLEARERAEQKLQREIKNAKDNWQPALESLVASIGKKFSAAFDRIGCAGEIRVSPHDDFDKWAIDILVKFRDKEKLQLLTGQRQSGGERSLTTILYLMSLTEEARTPFSLVDEINQGMDMRAERAVHDSMVEVTCKDDSAQYFLITPKLLADLNYHERMKILCVNNGEWLPEDKGLGNMMNMINTYVQHRNRSAAAT